MLQVVRFCYAQVPFYRRRWDEYGVKIQQIQGPDDLKLLPLVTKQDLIDHSADFFPKNMSRRFIHASRTGGSTGSPANFYQNIEARLREQAFHCRYWRWHGMNFWRDPKAVLRGSYKPPKNDVQRDWTNSYKMSGFDLTVEKLQHYGQVMADRKLKFLLAYPSLAERLADAIGRHSDLAARIHLQGVFVASEKLYPSQRQCIEQVFRCPVHTHYGHNENAVLMEECPQGDGYHLITDYGYTEFGPPIDADGLREIIGTGFNNMATPLVRYRTGDFARLRTDGACSCGLPFPKLVADVEGRSGDIVVTPGGRYIGPSHLEYAIRYITHFSDCQIIQESPTELSVLVMPTPGYTAAEGRAFADAVQSRLGEPMEISLKEVDQIPRPPNQKRRFVVSRLTAQRLGTPAAVKTADEKLQSIAAAR
ncbi:MAG: phenylacetate--CoA ligase family protein [Phycisphaeraceae bacterium]|nr:phenylacetate--CoA ligase family protein [Phycisphaeraceae bacterium]